MKKRNVLALALALLALPSMAFAQRNVKLTVNGKPVVSKPAAFISSDRTMVPLRFVAEALDYQVLWDEESRDILLTKMNFDTNKPEQAIYLKPTEKNVVVLNEKDVASAYNMSTKLDFQMKEIATLLEKGKKLPLEVAPVIKEDRAFIPHSGRGGALRPKNFLGRKDLYGVHRGEGGEDRRGNCRCMDVQQIACGI